MNNIKYVKVVGADGYDSVLANGDLVFSGPSLSVMNWISLRGIFISDVIGG